MKLTIKDIAVEAGVSKSTVSYVLNKQGPITKASHRRVIEVVKKYDFVPNASAINLATGVTNNIGLVFLHPDALSYFARPFVNRYMMEAVKLMNQRHGTVSLCFRQEADDHVLSQFLRNTKVDGLIFMNTPINDGMAKALLNHKTPFVCFGGTYDDYDMATGLIATDDYQGVKDGFNYLVSRQYKKIMFVSGCKMIDEKPVTNMPYRVKAYLDGVAEHQLNYQSVVFGYNTDYQCYKVIQQIFSQGKDLPDAIITGNDFMARGILSYAREHGLKVPEKLGLLAFDDTNPEQNKELGLSCIRIPFAEMIEESINYIYRCIEIGQMEPYRVNIPTRLITRESTK